MCIGFVFNVLKRGKWELCAKRHGHHFQCVYELLMPLLGSPAFAVKLYQRARNIIPRNSIIGTYCMNALQLRTARDTSFPHCHPVCRVSADEPRTAMFDVPLG